MIQPNELRIGNWVIWENIQVRIGASGILMLNDGELQYSPIPLTPEVLEKCGFESFEDGWYGLNKFGIGYQFTWNIYDKLVRWKGSWIKCESLHQLQNIYFALTGEELNYTP